MQDKCIVLIDGQKVELDNNDILQLIGKNVDINMVPDFFELFAKSTDKPKNELNIKVNDLKPLFQNDYHANVRTILKQTPGVPSTVTINNKIFITTSSYKVNSKEDKFNINETTKTVFGITVGKTKRKDVYKIIKGKIKEHNNYMQNDLFQSFDEIGVAFYFSALNDTVEEIILSSKFEGTTTKGLKINYSMDKAIELHGQPKIRSQVIAFWANFSVFIKDETITSIKIR
ncbi:MAG: hypothetical protein H7263_02115 [Candidatus Sericytochromatia bacterium]|nr:hypothetical protein [Candidatus Sericytochromatia bacterium]